MLVLWAFRMEWYILSRKSCWVPLYLWLTESENMKCVLRTINSKFSASGFPLSFVSMDQTRILHSDRTTAHTKCCQQRGCTKTSEAIPSTVETIEYIFCNWPSIMLIIALEYAWFLDGLRTELQKSVHDWSKKVLYHHDNTPILLKILNPKVYFENCPINPLT